MTTPQGNGLEPRDKKVKQKSTVPSSPHPARNLSGSSTFAGEEKTGFLCSKMTQNNSAKVCIQDIQNAVEYYPETGVFLWKISVGRCKKGQLAGTKNSRGYLIITVRGVLIRAHRMAFVLMTGSWPDAQIDHKNGDRMDNRWENLRICQHWQNNANKGKTKRNRSGYKGVSWKRSSKCWYAEIAVNNQRINLGLFQKIEDAADAYQNAAKIYHGDFAKF